MPTNEDLARRWLASPHWGGWRVGMVDEYGSVVTSEMAARAFQGETPDLEHPGTRAFLLEDVRRAWGGKFDYRIPHVIISHDNHGDCRVQVFCSDSPGFGQFVIYADTEAEALIAALEAAP